MRGVKAERGPEAGCHVDDRINAIDIEEEGNEIKEDSLAVGEVVLLGEDAEKPAEVVADGFRLAGNVVLLAIGKEEGYRKAKPPKGIDGEGYRHRDGGIQAGEDDKGDGDEEGKTASDVAKGVTLGGNVVGLLERGDVAKHRIVEDEGNGVEDLCENIDDQESDVRHRHRQGQASENAKDRGQEEKRPLESAIVGKRAKDRSKDGDDKGDDAGRIAPKRCRVGTA